MMDWQRFAAGWAITIGVPFAFIVLPVLIGKWLGHRFAQRERGK